MVFVIHGNLRFLLLGHYILTEGILTLVSALLNTHDQVNLYLQNNKDFSHRAV